MSYVEIIFNFTKYITNNIRDLEVPNDCFYIALLDQHAREFYTAKAADITGLPKVSGKDKRKMIERLQSNLTIAYREMRIASWIYAAIFYRRLSDGETIECPAHIAEFSEVCLSEYDRYITEFIEPQNPGLIRYTLNSDYSGGTAKIMFPTDAEAMEFKLRYL